MVVRRHESAHRDSLRGSRTAVGHHVQHDQQSPTRYTCAGHSGELPYHLHRAEQPWLGCLSESHSHRSGWALDQIFLQTSYHHLSHQGSQQTQSPPDLISLYPNMFSPSTLNDHFTGRCFSVPCPVQANSQLLGEYLNVRLMKYPKVIPWDLVGFGTASE
jgi:hypothetical protein